MTTTAGLTNLQQELLKIYSTDINEKQLEEIKQILIKYFAKKAMDKADKFWGEKKFKNDKDMENWLNSE